MVLLPPPIHRGTGGDALRAGSRAAGIAKTVQGPARRALLLLAAAMLVRGLYWSSVSGTACLDINLDPISDMEAFHRWAITIADGDWLGRGDFHPFHPWQTAIAPEAQWDRWYGHVYHQEPLYPYLVALIYRVAPRAPSSVILFQLAAGAAGCAAIYLAARRFVGEAAGLAAGILSILYGPYLYYESLMLRDSFLIPLHAVLMWTVAEASARPARESRTWWVAAGGLSGLSYLTKASVLPFVLLLAGWLLLSRRRQPGSGWGPAAGILLAGFALVQVPAVARNLVVGAPPLAITTRGPVEFINGNNRWHPGVGWFDGDDARVSTYTREILSRTGGRLLPTIGAVLSDWSSDLPGFLRLQVRKTGYLLAPFEMPNNASYSYFRQNVPQLRRAALSFAWISPLALLGLIVCWPSRRTLAPVLLFLGAGVALIVAFYVIARFRAPLMPAVMILAGAGVAWIAGAATRPAPARLAMAALVVAVAVSANVWSNYPDRDLIRPQDHLISIRGYQARGQGGRALAEAEAGRALFPGFGIFHRLAGQLLAEQGRWREAREALLRAVTLDPSDAEARAALAAIGSRGAP